FAPPPSIRILGDTPQGPTTEPAGARGGAGGLPPRSRRLVSLGRARRRPDLPPLRGGADAEGFRVLMSPWIMTEYRRRPAAMPARFAGAGALLLVCLHGAAGLRAGVLKGPYLTDMGPGSVLVVLETDAPLATEVRFWPE